MNRDFCKPIFTSHQIKKLYQEIDKLPKIDFMYNCHGDLLIFKENKIIGIERKDGKYIDRR